MIKGITEMIEDINMYLQECDNDDIVNVYNVLSTKKANIVEGDLLNFEVEE